MIDLSKFPCHKKPYADSTLRQMKKAILVRLLDIAEALGVMYSLKDDAIMFDFRNAGELTQENFFHEERGL